VARRTLDELLLNDRAAFQLYANTKARICILVLRHCLKAGVWKWGGANGRSWVYEECNLVCDSNLWDCCGLSDVSTWRITWDNRETDDYKSGRLFDVRSERLGLTPMDFEERLPSTNSVFSPRGSMSRHLGIHHA